MYGRFLIHAGIKLGWLMKLGRYRMWDSLPVSFSRTIGAPLYTWIERGSLSVLCSGIVRVRLHPLEQDGHRRLYTLVRYISLDTRALWFGANRDRKLGPRLLLSASPLTSLLVGRAAAFLLWN